MPIRLSGCPLPMVWSSCPSLSPAPQFPIWKLAKKLAQVCPLPSMPSRMPNVNKLRAFSQRCFCFLLLERRLLDLFAGCSCCASSSWVSSSIATSGGGTFSPRTGKSDARSPNSSYSGVRSKKFSKSKSDGLAAIGRHGAVSAKSDVLLDAFDSDTISAGGTIPADASESATQSSTKAVLRDTSDCSACICTGDAADSACGCIVFAGLLGRCGISTSAAFSHSDVPGLACNACTIEMHSIRLSGKSCGFATTSGDGSDICIVEPFVIGAGGIYGAASGCCRISYVQLSSCTNDTSGGVTDRSIGHNFISSPGSGHATALCCVTTARFFRGCALEPFVCITFECVDAVTCANSLNGIGGTSLTMSRCRCNSRARQSMLLCHTMPAQFRHGPYLQSFST